MSDSILAGLLLSLDAVVFERMPEGAFMEITPPPAWFDETFTTSSRGDAITLSQALPFLEVFLTDAESFWRDRRPGVARSGPFTVQHRGEQLLLRASAVLVGSRALLLLERLVGTADPREVLQKAREKSIEHERAVQVLDQLRKPLDAVALAASELVATELPSPQRALADEVARSAARMLALIGPLSRAK